MSPRKLCKGIPLLQAAKRIGRLATNGATAHATDTGPPLRLASVDLQRISLVERHISPKIDQAGAKIVDPVPAISQRIVIELPVGQPEVADLAYLAAEPQSLIADVLAAMADGYRQAGSTPDRR